MASIPRELGQLLFPTPRHVLDHGGRTPLRGVRLGPAPVELPAVGLLTDAGRAWRTSAPGARPLVVDIDLSGSCCGAPQPGADMDEAYELTVRGAHATIRSSGAAGAFYAAQTLIAAVQAVSEPDGCLVPTMDLRDAPTLRRRGTVEGFYGPPWTHQARLRHLRFSGRHRLNTYVYAPKNDPYHRDRWRDPYPDAELARFAELADEAARHHVQFVYALAPGTSMRFCDPAENALLRAKAEQLWQAGVQSFALLFDDIPEGLTDSADVARFGSAPGAAGSAHGWVAAQFAEKFLAPRGSAEPLLVCPADYDGTAASPYRTRLAASLPRDAVVWWSGTSVVSPRVTSEDVAAAAASYDRELLLWDNVPVNDFDRARMYLGPLRGRPHASTLVGITANPMIEALPSQLTLSCVAEYAWNPAGYDPFAATERAVHALTGGQVLPLVAACSGWPPDAPTGGQWVSTVADALGSDRVEARRAAETLRAELAGLADLQAGTSDLARELEPWRLAGAAMARAGRAAAELLLRDTADRADVAELRRALNDAESRAENVLRDTVSPFVRAVLHRFEQPAPQGSGPVAVLVSSMVPSAGEQALTELLRQHGFCVRHISNFDPTAPLPELVVISRWADPGVAREAARAACPVLALAHLVEAGLAARSGVLLREQHVRIVAPGHALAGGRTGAVPVYRLPGMTRWAEPAPEATVVARGEEEPHPVVVHYPEGARLADGTTAPAPRATSFLGRDLLAPWLMTADGTDLVGAAITALVPTRTASARQNGDVRAGHQRPTRTSGDAGIRRGRTDRGS